MRKNISSDEALTKLVAGNKRFSAGLRSVESMMSSMRMKELAVNGQRPYAIILACSDSRVPAEIVFDCGLGDLFVIRMAGNVVTPEVVASIEFAASSFGSELCVVMGHSSCGAINAAIDVFNNKLVPPSLHLKQLLDHISEPICTCKRNHSEKISGLFSSLVTEENVRHSGRRILQESEILRGLGARGLFKVVGGVYDIQNGNVEIVDSTIDIPGVGFNTVEAAYTAN